MLVHLRAQVDVGEHVPVEHQKALLEHRLGELQRPRGPPRLGLFDEAQAQPQRRAVAEHVAHGGGQKAAGHDHVLDAVGVQPFEHVGDERPVNKGDHRLGHGRGQGPQARALAAHEDERLHQPPPPISQRLPPRADPAPAGRGSRAPRPTPS